MQRQLTEVFAQNEKLKIERDKRLKEVVIKFGDKLALPIQPELDGSYILPTNRLELRFLHEVVKSAYDTHVGTIVPNYANKSQKDTHYLPYYKAALEMTTLLSKVLNKIENTL